jgi:Ca-activated chloride channel family protein
VAQQRWLVRKRYWTAAAIVVLVSLPGRAGQASAQDFDNPESRISVDVNLVVLHATVMDRGGHVIPDLRQQDFMIYEDDAPQTIRVFAHDDVPVAAGLVVDHSGSMQRKLAEVTKAARTFADLSNPEDRMFVVNFNERVSLGLPPEIPFTGDPEELERAITQAPVRGRTALYDGIAEALDHLKAATLDRKVLIAISDGGDNASRHKLAGVLKRAEQSSATIYTIGIYDDDDPDRNPRVLRSLAHATGGLSFISNDTGELVTFCTRIAHDVRTQYTLGYVPSKPASPGEYRSVRVAAKSPRLGKLIVRARAGYRIADQTHPAEVP